MGIKSPFFCCSMNPILHILLSNDLTETLLPQRVDIYNWGFIVFLFCFLSLVYFFGKDRRLVTVMFENIFTKNRDESSSEQNNNYTLKSIFLNIQTIILSAIFIFCSFSHYSLIEGDNIDYFAKASIVSFIVIFIFLLYKFISTNLIGYVFFNKRQITIWNNQHLSIISLGSLLLFPSVLTMFYVKEAFIFCFYFNLTCFFLMLLLSFRSTFFTFFAQKGLSLYFILYLCAQEIVPLYLFFRVIMYLFIALKDTLWLQM